MHLGLGSTDEHIIGVTNNFRGLSSSPAQPGSQEILGVNHETSLELG